MKTTAPKEQNTIAQPARAGHDKANKKQITGKKQFDYFIRKAIGSISKKGIERL